MRILGLIPARAGSKGVPGKNLRVLAGKPLLAWTVDAARGSGVLDRLVVSTENDRIAEVALSLGVEVPFRRPRYLATDEAPMIDVVVHALNELAEGSYVPDLVALLQPTSPLRLPEHIRHACEVLDDADSVCSVVAVRKELSPHFVMRLDTEGYLHHFLPDGARYTRRQDVPTAYRRDGTIYLTKRQVVIERRSLYGDRCTPMILDGVGSLTIDEPSDWTEAERRLQARIKG